MPSLATAGLAHPDPTALDSMCDLTGTASLDRAHQLSRCRRDAQALRGHLATNGQAVEYGGQVAFGPLAEHVRV